jgi:tetratricopeptide (TPR) repeat protein
MKPSAAPSSAKSDMQSMFAIADKLSAPANVLPDNGTRNTAVENRAAGSMDSAVASLSARLAQGGGAPGDWELLAKSYEFLGEPDEAARARAHQLPAGMTTAGLPAAPAVPLSAESLQLLSMADRARHDRKLPEALAIYVRLAAAGQMSAQAWADYADVAATMQSGRITGDSERFVANALALDPQNPKALWLKATSAEQGGRFAAAVEDWRQLQVLLAPNTADAKIVASNLDQDLKRAESAASTLEAQHARVVVSGEVTLARELSGKATAGETLFIVAKSVDSPGPPVAVIRGSVGAWPLKFTLDDSRSMIPGRSLSTAGRVTIEVRISRKGQPLPAAGDLQGTSAVINPAEAGPLNIVIDRVVT